MYIKFYEILIYLQVLNSLVKIILISFLMQEKS